MEYFEQEQNIPNRTDHYLMQVALEIKTAMDSFGKKNAKRSLSDFLIKFTRVRKMKRKLTKEERRKKIAASKSAWFGATQYKGKR